ncbi:pre-rRNA processing protein, partial [Kappamyces sp. JEL0680]
MVMEFRDDKAYGSSFPYKEDLENALYASIQSIGIQTFASHVKLNIEVEDSNDTRRPYLLATFGAALQCPLAFSSWDPVKVVGPHSLGFFLSSLLPLADRLLNKAAALVQENKVLQAKLYETLGMQIWDLFPLLCANLPYDVAAVFGKLAPHLGKILTTAPTELYTALPSNPDLRPLVCQGLDNLVESFSSFASLVPEEEDDSARILWKTTGAAVGKTVVAKMQPYVNRFLSALCNLYIAVDASALSGSTKGQALQTIHERSIQHYEKPIRRFLSIAEKSAIAEYFLTMVKSVLERESQSSSNNLERLAVYATFDLMFIFLPHLPRDDVSEESSLGLMYKLLLGQLKETDSTLQKKTYKALSQLLSIIPWSLVDEAALVSSLLSDEVVSQ